MDLDINAEYLKFDPYDYNAKLSIKNLVSVKKFFLTFGQNRIYFICAEDEKIVFLYEDAVQYAALLKFVAENQKVVGNILKKYANSFGTEHELWKRLLHASAKKFGINFYDYLRACGFEHPLDSDYANYLVVLPQKIDDLNSMFDFLVSVLPENIEETRRKKALQEEALRKAKQHQQEELRKQEEQRLENLRKARQQQLKEKRKCKAETSVQKVLSICGENFSNKDRYLQNLEAENGSNLSKWEKFLSQIKTDKADLDYFKEYEDSAFDSATVFAVTAALNFYLEYTKGKIARLIETSLIRQFGPVSGIKKNLRNSINRLSFMELLELFREYKAQESYFSGRAEQAGSAESAAPYQPYIDVYRLGSVLISDRMNQINRNKAKVKYISPDLLNEAMVFYYDADSPQDAYATRSAEIYSQAKESGDKGEKKVDYALKWLDASYTVIEKRSKDKAGSPCILLFNPDFIDEKQEYDHLIVSCKGVFNIETKNLAGKLVIDKAGNWIRKKDGDEEGVKNPLQQVRQHEKLLASFLPKECRIISILCIANDKAIIEGSEHCPIPIVKSDLLVEFIENWQTTDSELSDEQKKDCITAIYERMV